MRTPFAISIALALASALVLSCQAIPKDIDTKNDREIIQLAQEASDTNSWSKAKTYYQMVLDRKPEDMAIVCACEYEIAFIDYKAGRYAEAEKGFQALLARYEGEDAKLLPQEYLFLAQKILPKAQKQLSKAKAK